MSDPRTQGAFPIDKPKVSPEERLEHAKHVLNSVRNPSPVPPDFDPLQASHEELQAYGLPPRPDNNPEQEASWKELILKIKAAELVVPDLEIFSEDKIPLRVKTQGDQQARNYNGHNWAGAVIDKSVCTQTRAVWTVPNPFPGKGDGPTWYSAAWVGLDGWSSPDVLQGGTRHDITKGKDGRFTRDIFAWYEWYPAYPIRLKNFPLSVGDKVACYVWDINVTLGHFLIINYTTGKYVSISFEAPTGTKFEGDSAEWVVEDPSDTDPEADFKVVTFTECWAVRNGYWVNLSDATVIVSTNDDGSFCTAEKENDTTLEVTYHAG